MTAQLITSPAKTKGLNDGVRLAYQAATDPSIMAPLKIYFDAITSDDDYSIGLIEGFYLITNLKDSSHVKHTRQL